MDKELTTTETERSLPALSPKEVVEQVKLIQQIMKTVMKKGEHYDILPGTTKPCLLKAGAEKLCFTFRLSPNYEILKDVREEGYIEYIIKCTLTSIVSGRIIATSIGSCNSKEDKYLYRYEYVSTGTPVPSKYWQNRDQSLLGGEDFKPKKVNGNWVICKVEKVLNDNPYNLANTLLKMASKRALVGATLNGTAASDIFTQDVEDYVNEEEFERASEDEPVEPEEVKPISFTKISEVLKKSKMEEEILRRRKIVEELFGKIKVIYPEYTEEWWRAYLQKHYNVSSILELTIRQLQEITTYLAKVLNVKQRKKEVQSEEHSFI